jgi:putative endonuclease
MFYTYILQSIKDKKLYTGCTDDLRARLKRHNVGNVPSTKGRGPFKIIYYEACENANDAYTREKYLKTGMGKRYLKNRLKRALALTTTLIIFVILTLIPSITHAGVILNTPSSLGLSTGLVGWWTMDPVRSQTLKASAEVFDFRLLTGWTAPPFQA